MTTTVRVETTHGWPVDVTPVNPETGELGEVTRVQPGEGQTFLLDKGQDLMFHEVQPCDRGEGMMSDLHRAVMAFSATVFTVLLLGSLIYYGTEVARLLALFATFCAVVSQFTGQDRGAVTWHLLFSYTGMVTALTAIVAFAYRV